MLESVGFDRGGIYLYNPKIRHNKLILHKNVHPEFIKIVEDVDLSEGLYNEIFDLDKPVYIEDYSEFIEGSKELNIYSGATVPLRSKEEYVGSLNIGSPVHQVLSQNELELLVGIGKQMGIIIQKFEAEISLKESEEKYRNLFNDAPLGIFLFDDEGYLLDGNTTATSTFSGFPVSISIGKHFSDITPLFKNDKDLLELFIQRAKDQKMGKILKPMEFKVIREDGQERWLYWQSSNIKLHDKSITQVVIQDITERKEAEQLIIEENLKLQELSEIRQDLITRISHELKTPITSIHGASQALLEMYKKDMTDVIIEFVEIIQRGGTRLKSLVENLLDTSRLESKKIELKLQEENIVDIIREHVNDLRYFAIDRKLNVNLNLPNELILTIDKLRIGQVITNIVSNAINNTLPGGNVSIGINETHEHVDIIIKDTGVGITKEEIKKLFEKFGKIERFGKGYDVFIEGSGLGLFISKEFVELHGGQILVESGGRNEGATFTIRLNKDKNM